MSYINHFDGHPLESGNALLQTIHSSNGGRALKLLNERNEKKKKINMAKMDIEKKSKLDILSKINDKYIGSNDYLLEESFREQTVGLVTAKEFREKRKKIMEEGFSENTVSNVEIPPVEKIVKRKISKSKLSFSDDIDDSCDFLSVSNLNDIQSINGSNSMMQSIKKDPTVNTSFLSDTEREKRLKEEKEKIIKEYYELQNQIKEEYTDITFSYWDAMRHKRVISIKKGLTIGQFLACSKSLLESDFPELSNVHVDNLMYVKEDLIIPNRLTFYDIMKKKVIGNSGPLFTFNKNDNLLSMNDNTADNSESLDGIIVEKKWYDKNKHIFPASRWELYDPLKNYEKYSIRVNQNYILDL